MITKLRKALLAATDLLASDDPTASSPNDLAAWRELADRSTVDAVKMADQIELLKACREFTDAGTWPGLFSYQGCGSDLVKQGLATDDKKITPAGRAVLWFLGEGDDPTPSKSYISHTIPLKTRTP